MVNKKIDNKEFLDSDLECAWHFLNDFNQIFDLVDLTIVEVPNSIKNLLNLRKIARQKGNWEESDSLRLKITKMGFNIQDTENDEINKIVQKEAEIISHLQSLSCRVIERLGGVDVVANQLAHEISENGSSVCAHDSSPSVFSLINYTLTKPLNKTAYTPPSSRRLDMRKERNRNIPFPQPFSQIRGGAVDFQGENKDAFRRDNLDTGSFALMARQVREDRSLTPDEKAASVPIPVCLKIEVA